ncbi:hypothetical protein HYU14_02650 [Candidatus Woesearchaeota archaeon]|nr:hypothetical protein [Candidatus Woesearchaeota archaeon]
MAISNPSTIAGREREIPHVTEENATMLDINKEIKTSEDAIEALAGAANIAVNRSLSPEEVSYLSRLKEMLIEKLKGDEREDAKATLTNLQTIEFKGTDNPIDQQDLSLKINGLILSLGRVFPQAGEGREESGILEGQPFSRTMHTIAGQREEFNKSKGQPKDSVPNTSQESESGTILTPEELKLIKRDFTATEDSELEPATEKDSSGESPTEDVTDENLKGTTSPQSDDATISGTPTEKGQGEGGDLDEGDTPQPKQEPQENKDVPAEEKQTATHKEVVERGQDERDGGSGGDGGAQEPPPEPKPQTPSPPTGPPTSTITVKVDPKDPWKFSTVTIFAVENCTPEILSLLEEWLKTGQPDRRIFQAALRIKTPTGGETQFLPVPYDREFDFQIPIGKKAVLVVAFTGTTPIDAMHLGWHILKDFGGIPGHYLHTTDFNFENSQVVIPLRRLQLPDLEKAPIILADLRIEGEGVQKNRNFYRVPQNTWITAISKVLDGSPEEISWDYGMPKSKKGKSDIKRFPYNNDPELTTEVKFSERGIHYIRVAAFPYPQKGEGAVQKAAYFVVEPKQQNALEIIHPKPNDPVFAGMPIPKLQAEFHKPVKPFKHQEFFFQWYLQESNPHTQHLFNGLSTLQKNQSKIISPSSQVGNAKVSLYAFEIVNGERNNFAFTEVPVRVMGLAIEKPGKGEVLFSGVPLTHLKAAVTGPFPDEFYNTKRFSFRWFFISQKGEGIPFFDGHESNKDNPAILPPQVSGKGIIHVILYEFENNQTRAFAEVPITVVRNEMVVVRPRDNAELIIGQPVYDLEADFEGAYPSYFHDEQKFKYRWYIQDHNGKEKLLHEGRFLRSSPSSLPIASDHAPGHAKLKVTATVIDEFIPFNQAEVQVILKRPETPELPYEVVKKEERKQARQRGIEEKLRRQRRFDDPGGKDRESQEDVESMHRDMLRRLIHSIRVYQSSRLLELEHKLKLMPQDIEEKLKQAINNLEKRANKEFLENIRNKFPVAKADQGKFEAFRKKFAVELSKQPLGSIKEYIRGRAQGKFTGPKDFINEGIRDYVGEEEWKKNGNVFDGVGYKVFVEKIDKELKELLSIGGGWGAAIDQGLKPVTDAIAKFLEVYPKIRNKKAEFKDSYEWIVALKTEISRLKEYPTPLDKAIQETQEIISPEIVEEMQRLIGSMVLSFNWDFAHKHLLSWYREWQNLIIEQTARNVKTVLEDIQSIISFMEKPGPKRQKKKMGGEGKVNEDEASSPSESRKKSVDAIPEDKESDSVEKMQEQISRESADYQTEEPPPLSLGPIIPRVNGKRLDPAWIQYQKKEVIGYRLLPTDVVDFSISVKNPPRKFFYSAVILPMRRNHRKPEEGESSSSEVIVYPDTRLPKGEYEIIFTPIGFSTQVKRAYLSVGRHEEKVPFAQTQIKQPSPTIPKREAKRGKIVLGEVMVRSTQSKGAVFRDGKAFKAKLGETLEITVPLKLKERPDGYRWVWSDIQGTPTFFPYHGKEIFTTLRTFEKPGEYTVTFEALRRVKEYGGIDSWYITGQQTATIVILVNPEFSISQIVIGGRAYPVPLHKTVQVPSSTLLSTIVANAGGKGFQVLWKLKRFIPTRPGLYRVERQITQEIKPGKTGEVEVGPLFSGNYIVECLNQKDNRLLDEATIIVIPVKKFNKIPNPTSDYALPAAQEEISPEKAQDIIQQAQSDELPAKLDGKPVTVSSGVRKYALTFKRDS